MGRPPDPVEMGQFARDEGLAMVLLFGSRGRRPDSDWDLALLSENECETLAVEERLIGRLKRGDLDFLWLHQASPLAAWQVAKNGEVLYQDRPERFRRFYNLAKLRQADDSHWQEHNRRFVKRALEGRWAVDKDLVMRKLALLAQYLQELKQIMEANQHDFEADFRIHRVAERQIELLVECAASINTEVCQAVAKIPPSDYYSSFHSLAATGWIDKEIASRLATLAGLRNRLVHQYEAISLGQLYSAVKRSVPDWTNYLQSISDRLD